MQILLHNFELSLPQKVNDLVFITGLNLARIWYMALQGIALSAFFIKIHEFIPSSFQAAAVFKKHRFFLVCESARKQFQKGG